MGPRNWIARSALALLAGWAAPAPAQPADPAPGAAQRVFELRVAGRKPEGGARTVRAVRGEQVTLKVQSDQKLTIHVHGYDARGEVVPGTPATVTFTARWAGRFPITAHLPDAKTGRHHGTEPTLMYLEVRPE